MVLPLVPGWSRQVFGDVVELRSSRAQARYVDGLAPIVRFAAFGAGPATRFVTLEGEHAAVADTAAGAIAIVLGDYHYARLDVIAADGAQAIARELAARVSFGLGTRRRRVWHAPPAGWLGVARGLATEWIAPAPPRGDTRLRVYPATPARLNPDEVAAAIVDEQRGGGAEIEVVDQRAGARGTLLRTRSPHGWCDWSIERVMGYQYTARLESIDAAAHEAARPVFDAVVASIERVPTGAAAVAGALDHWMA